MSIDYLKRLVIEPLFEAIGADCDAEERRSIEQEIEKEVVPAARSMMETSKSVFETWLGEETLRIYAPR